MDENVRLVIWDLDETFWDGTLTEGGARIRQDTCELVKLLARRGIISSICSKNDYGDVQSILTDAGVWDYFVFPSINWEPKGHRVRAIVDAVQLRAPTVMFIDDNPLNLEEVKHFVPGIQTRTDEFISQISTNPLFAGKPDDSLTRLSQYKLLEARKRDEAAAGPDVSDFLRSSNITVDIERDLEAHIDRVVEMINRTNQLNFTKSRVSEDANEARQQVRSLLGRYNTQAGLIRVRDRYGDHGFAGLYIMNSEANRLIHFCFSCRILGMGIENWVYNVVCRRPHLEIKGEVLSDPTDKSVNVDWINQHDASGSEQSSPLTIGALIVHGGCDLSAIAHYFGAHSVEIVPEFNVVRDNVAIRADHTMLLRYACEGVSAEQIDSAKTLGYVESDFFSNMFVRRENTCCIILSFATDAHHAVYRHLATNVRLPCWLGLGPTWSDQRSYEVNLTSKTSRIAEIHRCLRSEFEFCGLIGEVEFKSNIETVLSHIDQMWPVFIVRPFSYHTHQTLLDQTPADNFVRLNNWTSDVARNFHNVTILDMPEFVRDRSDIQNILHFDRKVYFRAYDRIFSLLQDRD